jgi:uncharacterized protein YecE (DUF72 family)
MAGRSRNAGGMPRMPVVIGTSGWQYRDWRGPFYPAGLAQARWLEYYARAFPAVENNGTFYRLPAAATFASWRDRTPDGFLMVVKASRYLTHIRRLRDPAEPVARLLGAAAHLGPRLGPVLLQLPPTMAADPDALDGCLEAFSKFRPPAEVASAWAGVRVAVEFRHQTWWTERTRDVLARHDAALCWSDRKEEAVSPLWRTASWGYLRLHEGAGRPWPRYRRKALSGWISALADNWQAGEDAFVFFNNDQGAAAPHDASAFAALAKDAGLQVRPAPPAASG